MSPHRNPLLQPRAGPKPAADCIGLDALVERARALDALDHALRQLLPIEVARETRLADVRNRRVVLLASSSAWASRVRLYHATLLAEARRALGSSVEHVTVKVAPLPTASASLPAKPKPLSTAAARHLRTTANITSDPELAALYLQLAALAKIAD